ncbi:MAG: hypothetical protein IKQ33_02910 [Clostridia bacterium]|nr:hypothetical protein [Clostridia bacterium]
MKVALIGLDGSGKSANINLMKKDNDYKDFDFLWVRWQPSVTLLIYKLKHRKDVVDVRKSDESGKRKQNKLSKEYSKKASIKGKIFKVPLVKKIWMAYAICDYKKQFIRKTQGALLANKNIVFDRYYLDLFIDQGINFGYTPQQIYAEISKYKNSFPKMDKVVYINVAPEVCFARKDDIPSMDYLLRRYEIYKYISEKENWIVINGELDLNSVYAEIKKVILGK